MTTARELAIEILPHFQQAVLAGHVYAYGHYAEAIGRRSATESMVIGKAMHAIGAVCVLARVPIAPLYFVERADGEWRGVFESDLDEFLNVWPHYDLLYVTAREFKYTDRDFSRILKGLVEVLPKHMLPDQLSPHDIWRWILNTKLPDNKTPWDLALARYQEIFEKLKVQRNADLNRGSSDA